jgi:hypothetical protein
MNRRDLFRAGVATGALPLAHRPLTAQDQVPRVMTVRGPIAPEQMGPMLPHRHVLVDFVDAASDSHAGGTPGEDRRYHRSHRVGGLPLCRAAPRRPTERRRFSAP